MSSKSILILGAGLMQKPAIESAKSLGLKVFLVDANPNAVCVPLADEFRQIDLKDKESIAQYAVKLKKNQNLVSIFTAGTDFSTSVSYACEKSGLLSHPYESSCNASFKTLMRKCFDREKVASPKFTEIKRNEICETLTHDFLANLKYPLVVKPVDNMGARGCRMIRQQDELLYSIEEALKNSRSGTCILEEYMNGDEFSIDALVYDDTMTITGFADRHIFFPPYFIETGHTMPSEVSKEKYTELIKTFASGVKALGLTRGAAKADIKYTQNGAMIGEIAARLSGGYMSGWTFPYSSDFNLTKAAIQISCGETPSELESLRIPLAIDSPFKLFYVPSKKVSAERAWISIPGTVKKIHNSNKNCPDIIKNVFPRINEKDKVTFPRNNVEKCGNVISVSTDRTEAVCACENYIKNITLELEPDNKDTEYFLQGKSLPFEKDFPPKAFPFSEQLLDSLYAELNEKKFLIPENADIFDYVPDTLNKKEILSLVDWNYLSLQETLEKFNIIRQTHKPVEYQKFWTYLINGGIQGALYATE